MNLKVFILNLIAFPWIHLIVFWIIVISKAIHNYYNPEVIFLGWLIGAIVYLSAMFVVGVILVNRNAHEA